MELLFRLMPTVVISCIMLIRPQLMCVTPRMYESKKVRMGFRIAGVIGLISAAGILTLNWSGLVE